MKIKVKDIAKAAGVSTTAVSLVLNGRPNRLSETTKEKIKRIATELAFQSACGDDLLNAPDQHTIGLVVPDNQDPYMLDMIRYLQTYAFSKGCIAFACMTGIGVAYSRAAVSALARKGVDGLIYLPPQELEKEDHLIKTLKTLQDQGIPIVLLDCAVYSLFCDFVSSDNKYAGRLAVDALHRQGHTKIGCITGPLTLYTAKMRLQGYRDGLSRNKLPIESALIQTGIRTEDEGCIAAKTLWQNGCTAIFAASPTAAMGVLQFTQENNIALPSELSVIGYDLPKTSDIPFIRQDMHHMAELAVDLMLERLEPSDDAIPPRNFYLTPELIEP